MSPRRPLPQTQYGDDEVLHLIALNQPFSGNMGGVRGADFACYHQARAAGFTTTFRAFISSQVQDLDKIVHHSDRQTPVVNLKGEILFGSWADIFKDGGGHLPEDAKVYSFDRREVLQDPSWPQKYIWHGSDTRGIRREGKFCEAWRSEKSKDTGMASPLDKHLLLDQQDFNCNTQFVVLCIENMSKKNIEKRLGRKRGLHKDVTSLLEDEAVGEIDDEDTLAFLRRSRNGHRS